MIIIGCGVLKGALSTTIFKVGCVLGIGSGIDRVQCAIWVLYIWIDEVVWIAYLLLKRHDS